ncbi:Penicillin-binding protein 4 precursor [Peptoniphilus harei]|uniref:transglycosylase domain-containing protein n=1 Tax=Peptoniphilus harei TaxID=54005 RepID=UPI000F6BF8E5|nr:transglycosylase domain-containing protein [Peptoniphilus harei]MDU2373665.1 transglycosylase domain-containing protein [Peptoniphilus harei]QQE47660.1 transglycosylase domain-containing protein [Peptoniphilus harei]VEJ33768.1 Penicillin-binding protein 4 precursor [Peptoniphilus harei]
MKDNRNNKPRGMIKLSSIIKILLLIVVAAIIILGSLVTSIILGIFKKAPVIEPSEYRSQLSETSRIYSSDGKLIESLISDQFSEFVPYEDIPKDLVNAIVAIEDERFFEHNGVDYKRVVGAIVHDIKTRSFEQGASTITMQLAKNLYTSFSKSVVRKITDVYYSYQIEQDLSKEQILEAYLNSAGFSKGTVGVQAAAKTFFNKDVSELDLAECALIAGVTNLPEKYTPYNTQEINESDDLGNIEIVLLPKNENSEPNSDEIIRIAKNLNELGQIDNFDLIQIQNDMIVPVKAVFNETSQERQRLVLKRMLNQGLINQEDYDRALNEKIEINIGSRKESGISSFYTDVVQKNAIKILTKSGYSQEEATNKLFNGGLKIYTPMDINMQRTLEEVVSNPRYYYGGFTDKNGIIQPQVASVIIDQKTHEVKALVGGRNVSGGRLLNRALVPRQPGSSIKPISVYLTALNNGATAGDVYLDQKMPERLFGHSPRNAGNYYQGWTTIRNLLRQSSNVGAYQVARDISADKDAKINRNSTYSKAYNDEESINKMVETLKSIGISTIVEKDDNPTWNDMDYAPLTLGGMSYGISPFEMAGAFTAISNGGKYANPYVITKIESNTGEVIYQVDPKEKEVTSPQNAYILTDMLKDVVRRGTGRNASFPGQEVAGKTGTTNDKKDVWFVGYTPYYTCSVWIGNDKNQKLAFGSTQSAYLWKQIMKSVHQDLDRKEFEEPEGIYTKYSGGRREIFAEGTKPHYTNKYGFYKSYTKKKKVTKNNDNNNDNKKSKKSSDNNNNSSRKKKKSSKSIANNED